MTHRFIHIVIGLAVATALCTLAPAQDKPWRDVSPDDLRSNVPKVEPGADAEAIFWEVSVVDDYVPRAGFKTVLNHYLRVKIFTERGREMNSKVDLPFGRVPSQGVDVEISGISCRTIKPDGNIVILRPEDIFEREITKSRGVRTKAKSFAVPGIEIGAIVEYRWKEIRNDEISYYIRLDLARDIPVRFVKYSVRPVRAPGFTLGMRIHSFRTTSDFVKESDGFYSTSMTNVPAVRDEPNMPPEYTIKPWLLIFYDSDDSKTPIDDYWKEFSKRTYKGTAAYMKPKDDIKAAAALAVGSATEPIEKIRNVFNYVRGKVKNVDDDANGITAEQKRQLKPNKTPSDVLKRGSGNWAEIDMLFGSMLTALGFDARVARVPLRTEPAFDRSVSNDFFLRTASIAVKLGDEWRFFAPGTTYTNFGMDYWTVEGQEALISDPEEAIWAKVPISTSEESNQKRKGHMRLNADGSLDGTLELELTGHLASAQKEQYDDLSEPARQTKLKEFIKQSVSSSAEVTEISIENAADPDRPLRFAMKVHIPGYVDKTGSRMFLRPNVFERGANPPFSAGTRKYEVFFDFPWSEDDDVTIELPAGYALENLDVPPTIQGSKGVGSHATSVVLSDDKKVLKYKRTFSFGNGKLEFGVDAYPRLKELFDRFADADSFAVTLKQAATQK